MAKTLQPSPSKRSANSSPVRPTSSYSVASTIRRVTPSPDSAKFTSALSSHAAKRSTPKRRNSSAEINFARPCNPTPAAGTKRHSQALFSLNQNNDLEPSPTRQSSDSHPVRLDNPPSPIRRRYQGPSSPPKPKRRRPLSHPVRNPQSALKMEAPTSLTDDQFPTTSAQTNGTMNGPTITQQETTDSNKAIPVSGTPKPKDPVKIEFVPSNMREDKDPYEWEKAFTEAEAGRAGMRGDVLLGEMAPVSGERAMLNGNGVDVQEGGDKSSNGDLKKKDDERKERSCGCVIM